MTLRYDPQALTDLSNIFDYISEYDTAAATRVVARIREACEILVRHPTLGRKTDWPGIKVRPVVQYPYLVFFTSTADDIVILHIRHTSRDRPRRDDLGR